MAYCLSCLFFNVIFFLLYDDETTCVCSFLGSFCCLYVDLGKFTTWLLVKANAHEAIGELIEAIFKGLD